MSNSEQIEHWNGTIGERWVQYAERFDEMLARFLSQILNDAALETGERVLDIGCGGGALTLAAEKLGTEATGVDISAPLLALARDQAKQAGMMAQFIEADASSWSSDAAFDVMISRFGVMFFDDPVAAFANIRSNMKPTGRLAFTCWQPLPENDWALAPLIAAMPFLKEPPQKPEPGTPGPFAFGDKNRLASLLADAGWKTVEIEPWRGPMALPGDSILETAEFMMELGPLKSLLDAQGIDRAQVETALVERLAAATSDDGQAVLEGATWQVRARV